MRRPLRVLMTADTVGGVWTYAVELSAALARYRAEICLATLGPPPSAAQREAATALPNVTLKSLDCRLEWMEEAWDDVERSGAWLQEVAAAFRPDVVHLNGYAHGALPWRVGVLVVAHSCVLSWWRAVRREDAPAEWDRYREALRSALAAADIVVAPSRSMLDSLITHYGALSDARVVPNGSAARGPRNVPKEPFVLSAGRLWDEAKNLAAVDVAAREVSWPVYVAGPQAHPCGGHAGAAHARLLGQLSPQEIWRWQARAAIFALPVRYEPFGLSALEAARAGCALVLGDIPSQREIWRDVAVFVAPDDTRALAAAIQALIDDPDRRADMARRARRRAARFSAVRMAAAYHDLYQRLATDRSRARLRVAA
ncbi:MAG TPA: glycosyltransferase family 4 protein [Alphaproteobacteria bacterium]|nr:glycosyltransferase family 4 protein [Alphaproteobacteria bacterium]